MKPDVSLCITCIIPVFNEAHNLTPLYTRLKRVLDTSLHSYSYELIFIDDGSSDHSLHVLHELADIDRCIRIISFTRNFGHQAALSAGYTHARGDVVITIDADMQDPPEIIIRMIHEWEKGAAIVYARRATREDSLFKKLTASLFYVLLDYVSDVHMPRNVGDFRLIDRSVCDVINQFPEHARYLRGMIAWTGFNHAFVDFDRCERATGTSGYTWKKMFRLAFDGLTSFSLFPLKLAAFFGVFVVVTGVMMFVYITCDTFFFGKHYPLFKWLVTALYIFMGTQFFLLWLLGEYIGRMYDQVKGRPLYIIKHRVHHDATLTAKKRRIEHEAE